MRCVTDTVELTLREGCTLAELEELISDQLQRAGRDLLIAACSALEDGLLENQAADLQPNKRRPRDLLTRFGWIRLSRWSARDRSSGQYHYPLDEALAMEPRQHASPWVMRRAIELAAKLSYREATALLAHLIGTEVDHRTLWGWVQDAMRSHSGANDAAMHGDGDLNGKSEGGVEPLQLAATRTTNGHLANGHQTNGHLVEQPRKAPVLA